MARRSETAAVVAAALLLVLFAPATPVGAGDGRAGQVPVCLVQGGASGVERDVRVSRRAAEELLRRTLSYPGPCASYGESRTLGNGDIVAFSQQTGAVPLSIGVALRDTALQGLPFHPPTGGLWCHDLDGDGVLDEHHECVGGYENVVHFSAAFRSTVDTPFQFLMMNWNPTGHIPVGVYNVQHFDFHFYAISDAERRAIRTGPCPMLTNCDDYAVAKRPLPQRYQAPDYQDLDAVEPGMGNHLIDLTGPEFNGQPFTHTWIYGLYDAAVTFYEPMITHAWLSGLVNGTVADLCVPFKLPQAWARAGWYPTVYCLRHRANRAELTVSLESFVYRHAG